MQLEGLGLLSSRIHLSQEPPIPNLALVKHQSARVIVNQVEIRCRQLAVGILRFGLGLGLGFGLGCLDWWRSSLQDFFDFPLGLQQLTALNSVEILSDRCAVWTLGQLDQCILYAPTVSVCGLTQCLHQGVDSLHQILQGSLLTRGAPAMALTLVTGYAGGVEFLDRLRADDRARLLAASAAVHLKHGDILLRRGEAGGDLFLLESGSLEVVDSRQRPEVVLEVLGPGKILGVLSFLDGQPRAADVRAASAVTCRRWPQADLREILETDTTLNARFFEALSVSIAPHVRASTWHARGRVATHDGGPIPVAVAEKARDIVGPSRKQWIDAEIQLRNSASDPRAQAACREALDGLVGAVQSWVGPMGEHARARDAGEALRKEVQPYIGKAKLVFLAQEAGLGAHGAEFMAHLLLNEPSGDGPMGIAIDQALLDLPTAHAVRARQGRAVAAVFDQAANDRPLAITVVQPNCGALLAKVVSRLSGQGGEVTVIDGDRETLAIVDLGMHKRPDGVSLKLVQEDLGRLSSGSSGLHLEPQDAIVLDGLIDHLPDRMVAALCAWCAARLKPGGRLVVSAMAPASDQEVFDYLVGWPLLRRTSSELLELIRSAGLAAEVCASEPPSHHPDLVIQALR